MVAGSLSTSQRHLQVFLRVSVAGALCLRFVSCLLYVRCQEERRECQTDVEQTL